MTSRTDKVWPWRSLVAISVATTLATLGLHFFEQRQLRGTNELLDDLSTVRAAVYHAVAVSETTSANVSPPLSAVADLERVAPHIARLRAAALPVAEQAAVAEFLDSVAALDRQLVQGGLSEAQVQAALSRPDVLSARIDGSVRARRAVQRRYLDGSVLIVSILALALFGMVVASVRRADRRRARADRLLAEREERYRLMVESLQEGVLIFDTEARVEAGNSAAERVLGMTVAQFRQFEIDDWQAFDEQGRPLAAEDQPVSRSLRTGQPVRDVTLRVSRPEQPPVWLVITAVPLFAEDGGGVRGAVVTFTDVTADRATRLALAESESTSQALMNALQDGVFVAQDGAFVLANPSLASLLGYTPAEFEGLRFEAVVDPRQVDEWQAWIAGQTDETMTSRPREVRFVGRDGAPSMEFEALFSSATFRGRHAVLGLMRDISERQVARAELNLYRSHLEETVRARTVELETALAEGRDARVALQRLNDELVVERDRSAAASTAKSAFLANMSHEIRTPMNAIIGLTHLMRRENPAGTMGERLTRVAVAAQHLLKLLDDILDISKIDAGKLLLDDTEFMLDSLLTSACEMVTDAARAKGVELLILTDHVPRRLRGDPMRLSQALVNLLGNAVKFIERGSVTLAAHLLEQHGDRIRMRLEVRDTGPGIEPDKLVTLFDAFEQADSSTTRRYGGTGLGLAITRQLAQLMGGRAGAESELGVGSTFWIEIELRGSGPPAESVASAHGMVPAPAGNDPFEGVASNALDLAAEASLRASHAGARVLLAEDNRINEEVAVTLLTQAGLRVDVAHDGLEAVAMAARHGYQLILMDMQMPLLDGPAAAERIRALPASAQTPIVAMTASAYVEDRDRCMAAGMNDFIAKPVDPPRLYATIERWLGPMAVVAAGAPEAAQRLTIAETRGGLDRVDGLDAARGRAFFGGDDAIYRRALSQYCEMYAEGIAFERAGLPDDSALRATRLQRDLHSFAGASSAIGALALGAVASRLEKALRAGETLPPVDPMAELNAGLRRFVADVGACLTDPLPTAPRKTVEMPG